MDPGLRFEIQATAANSSYTIHDSGAVGRSNMRWLKDSFNAIGAAFAYLGFYMGLTATPPPLSATTDKTIDILPFL